MATDAQPFTVKIELDPLYGRRFRWTLWHGGQTILRSPRSYRTRREAEVEANQAMRRRAEIWRSIKSAERPAF